MSLAWDSITDDIINVRGCRCQCQKEGLVLAREVFKPGETVFQSVSWLPDSFHSHRDMRLRFRPNHIGLVVALVGHRCLSVFRHDDIIEKKRIRLNLVGLLEHSALG